MENNQNEMDELTAKRLAVIRLLFEKGKSLSCDGEPINGLCLLPFHDSVEMFMKLCAEKRNVLVQRSTTFAQYFDFLPDLQDKNQMLSLNTRRVNLKHHGQLPSSLDVEISKVNVIDFYEHNVPVFFDCKLEDVSLDALIVFPTVREYLRRYNDFFSQGKYGSAQAYCQIAFKEFLNCYYEQHSHFLSLNNAPGKNALNLHKLNFEKDIDKYLNDIREDVIKINEAINVMNLGINYFLYDEFMNHGVEINYWPENREYEFYIQDEANYDKNKTLCYYHFVIDNALRLQSTDILQYN